MALVQIFCIFFDKVRYYYDDDKNDVDSDDVKMMISMTNTMITNISMMIMMLI
jgi:hypothetical protein